MHHITAYGGALGNQSNLFQQAVLQSPSIHNPTGSHFQEEKIFNRFLYFANVSTIEAARNLPSETLQIASKKVVAEGPFGLFTFGKGLQKPQESHVTFKKEMLTLFSQSLWLTDRTCLTSLANYSFKVHSTTT